MAYGAEPAAGRRESREHAPTLGRTGVFPLGPSTGNGFEARCARTSTSEWVDQSEDDVEDAEAEEADVLVVLPEEESLEPEVDDAADAGVEDDELERLSVR